MIQGQFQIHFHSSLINNFKKKKKKYEPSQYESSHSVWYEPEYQLNFEVIDKFSKVYVSDEDLAIRRMHVDPVRLMFMFGERILIYTWKKVKEHLLYYEAKLWTNISLHF